MEFDNDFWKYLNKLVKENEIIIDRPKGTRHPKYNDMVYEFDYGYINNTKTTDGGGIDVFKGSLHNKNVNTIMCTIDLLKKDIEIKLLIGCTVIEKRKIYAFLNKSENMKALIIEKNIPAENEEREIKAISKETGFGEIYEVFEDIIGRPTEENVKKILTEYEKDKEKTLYGYYLNKKLVGTIGIRTNVENIEILHFGIHPEYRGKGLGTELMNFIKKENRTMVLNTDDDAIGFYKKYGYKYTEYYEEKYKKRRYSCKYSQ
jgi:inorganic pyrophosphatase